MHAPTSGWAGRSGDPAEPLTVVIDARIKSAESGGVEGILVGLAASLSELTDGPERYLFLGLEGQDDWLADHVSGSAQLIHEPKRLTSQSTAAIKKGLASISPGGARLWRRARPPSLEVVAPRPDPFVESLGPDVVHMPFQKGFLTRVPSIYHPHDLQHLHFPAFFPAQLRAWRELWYRELCAMATLVAVSSSWTKTDLVANYGLDPQKVAVVPLAPMTEAYPVPSHDTIRETAARLGLPRTYVLYPAQTWRHKNHVTLLRALAHLRVDGVVIPLVCTGLENEFSPELRRQASEFGVADQVNWLGFVSPTDLQVVYACARAVVIPSLFESASGPLWEGFRAGIPVVCSDVTSLPEQAGDAALLVDPNDHELWARAIQEIVHNGPLRARLIAAGRVRVGSFTWGRTARIFRAHYRQLGTGRLTKNDQELLEASAGL